MSQGFEISITMVKIILGHFTIFICNIFFQGNLSEQGKLIMQGSFQMSTEHKGKMKDLRFKPMQRQMFLHQKSILLCKRREDTHSSDKVVYSFKNLLKVSVKSNQTRSSTASKIYSRSVSKITRHRCLQLQKSTQGQCLK
jgi:hypothetical protein